MCLINFNGKKWLANIFGQKQNIRTTPIFTSDLYVRASEIGITADDKNHQLQPEAAEAFTNLHINNLSIIKYYANLGYRIYMDLDSVDIANDAGYSLTGDLYLEADENKPCILNISVDTPFVLTSDPSNISFKYIHFNASHNGVRLLYNNYQEYGAVQLDTLVVDHCEFTQVVLAGFIEGRLYLNDYIMTYIKHFSFTNNTVRNIDTSFAILLDVAFDLFEIKNNYVNNFRFVGFNLGTSNLTTDPSSPDYERDKANHDLLHSSKKRCVADHNTVINDLDWVQNRKSTIYHTFLLAECGEVIYTNNYAEGIKASIDMATYDFYAGAAYVLSENNVWKNNLCWAADNDNNTLMKAKGGNGYKYYRNNKYYITQEFVDYIKEHYNAPDAGLWIEFISIVDNAAWEVYNNIIDVAVMFRMFQASVPVTNMLICNNRIKALALDSCVIGKSASVDSTWVVRDNIYEETITEFLDNRDFALLTTVAEDGVQGTALLENNIFNTPHARMINVNADGRMPNENYAAKGNIFRIATTRNIWWPTFIDNTIIHEIDSPQGLAGYDDIVGIFGNSSYAGIKERHVKVTFDNRKTTCGSRLVYLEFYKGRNYHGWVNFTAIHTNGASLHRYFSFRVNKDEQGIQHLSVTDESTKKNLYNGLLYPETQVGQNLAADLRVVLYTPENGGVSRIQNFFQNERAECEMIIYEEV